MAGGLTLDTGALIAMERRDRRARALVRLALQRGVTVTAPMPAIVEWWRGGRAQAKLLGGIVREPLHEPLARVAGEALGRMRGARPSLCDLVVVVSAATRGDTVLTSDLDDLTRIRDAAGLDVRLLRV